MHECFRFRAFFIKYSYFLIYFITSQMLVPAGDAHDFQDSPLIISSKYDCVEILIFIFQ